MAAKYRDKQIIAELMPSGYTFINVPCAAGHGGGVCAIQQELATTVHRDVLICITPTCIVGDFNIKYNVEAEDRPLVQLLDSFIFIQHVTDSTHSVGHTPDFVITPKDDNLATLLTLFQCPYHIFMCALHLQHQQAS